MMKIVLGFDSWTKASSNYARLSPVFEKNGYKLILVHIGSWGHDMGRPKEENIGGLTVRDISYYNGRSILDILKLERPVALIFLSTRAFAHQAANAYSQYLNIPTLHLYHGIVSVQSVNTPVIKAYERSLNAFLVQFYQRFWKNFTLLIPTLFVALIKCRLPLSYWYKIIYDILIKIKNPQAQGTSPLIKTSLGCIYTEVDRIHMHNTYKLSHSDIYSVGNPDLIAFGFSEELIGYNFKIDRVKLNREVIYIDTSLVQAGFVFDSYKQYFKHLLQTEEKLKKHGFTMSFKPHPDHYHNGDLLDMIRTSSIKILDKDIFLEQLKSCSAVIVEPSTLSLIPALMGKILFLASYGKLFGQPYGKLLLDYPYSFILDDLNSFSKLTSIVQNQTLSSSFEKWVSTNSGPMPADKMPERVFDALCNYMTNDLI